MTPYRQALKRHCSLLPAIGYYARAWRPQAAGSRFSVLVGPSPLCSVCCPLLVDRGSVPVAPPRGSTDEEVRMTYFRRYRISGSSEGHEAEIECARNIFVGLIRSAS